MKEFFFLLQKHFFFNSGKTFFFLIYLTASAFLLPREILQNGDVPRQKPRYLPTAQADFECCK